MVRRDAVIDDVDTVDDAPMTTPVASTMRWPGIYLGTTDRGSAWAGPEQSTLVLGPSRSGKTSSLVIPNVLAAPGAVVSTSTKGDVLDATAAARRARGWTFVYDPSGTVDPPPGVQRIGWSPVNGSHQWDGALATADAMVRTAHAVRHGSSSTVSDHWSERATALLAPLLHAAALDGRVMRTVLRWVDRHDGVEALTVLGDGNASADGSPPADLLAGILTTDPREQSGIWSTASGALSAYRSAPALSSTTPPFLDAEAFCEGPNTLFVCASGRSQQLLAPLVVGLLGDIRDAAYRRAATGRRTPPVLLALDEAANISPLPDLPQLVTEGAGQGLLSLTCLQDLSQARARWGSQGDAFLSLFGTTIVLGGIADIPTLDALSALAGDVEVTTRSVTRGHDRWAMAPAAASTTVSTTFRRRLAVDDIARGVDGAALAVDRRNRIGWIGLTPAHRCLPWRALISPERVREPDRSSGRGWDR